MRIDQLLKFNWKFLVPFVLILLLATALLDKFIPETMGDWGRAGIHLLMNLVLVAGTLQILSSNARRQRAAQEAGRMGAPAEPEVEPHADPHAVPAH